MLFLTDASKDVSYSIVSFNDMCSCTVIVCRTEPAKRSMQVLQKDNIKMKGSPLSSF